MNLVICEKPSVAASIAKVLGARERKDGYLEGNGWIVSWCIGHLVGLCDAADYEKRYSRWNYDDLPIIPENWKYKVLDGTKKQFEVLKKLMSRQDVTEVVAATDAGREGELIFRLVYEQAGCSKPVKRLWISSMEDKVIRAGFADLKEDSDYDNLYASALARACADWLVGINASRLFSTIYKKNLKVGRVQTPTLAMIVERDGKVKGFEKKKYFVARLKFGEMDASSEHLESREEAEKIASDCKERMCQVEKDDVQIKTVRPPKLYDLTTLQREANRTFGYTAQETLDAVQSLYEKKMVTYPRTDSQYLTNDMGGAAARIAGIAAGFFDFWDDVKDGYGREAGSISRLLDSTKVSDHHAIIPTEAAKNLDVDRLSDKERDVFYLTAERLLEALGGSHIYESHKCQITCNCHTFYISARQTKQEGFMALRKKFRTFLGQKPDVEGETEMNIFLSKTFGPCDTRVEEKYTKPPLQYTEDTLLSAMERAGNEDLTEETEKKGLGTPATRAAVIEKLVRSGVVRREKKSLVPTEDGKALVSVLPAEIKSAKMTAEWEMKLNHIAAGTMDAEEFLKGIEEMLFGLTRRYQGMSADQKSTFSGSGRSGKAIGKCPRCGGSVVSGSKSFYCSEKGCGFCLWRNNRFLESQGKKMDEETAKKFLAKGQVYFRDLRSKKTGKTYAATVRMADSGKGAVQFELEFPQR